MFYEAAGFPEDEVVPAVLPLGYYGFFALVPSGAYPGGIAHRVIGQAMGLTGRRDFHSRAWREFNLFTHWLVNGSIQTPRP